MSSAPPRIGPSATPTPAIIAHIAIAFGISFSLNTFTMTARVAGIIIAVGATLASVDGGVIAIVIAVLLVFMGVRSGLLMGGVLLLTILGTFIVMKMLAIDLQRISLGALIIALGMLVDNAIVVTEGILVGMKRGMSKLEAAVDIVRQTIWPLLGATVIAIMAFAPIGLSEDATGEYTNTLFWVLLISLLLSWITAVTLVPAMAKDAEHVTMLQRSPTYIVSMPAENVLANSAR